MSALFFVAGPRRGQRIELGDGLLLGREQANVVIDDELLSRRHAAIRPTSTGAVVEDLGSTNGTYLNGVRVVRETPVAPGDRIGIGSSTFVFEAALGGGTDAVPQPAKGPPPIHPGPPTTVIPVVEDDEGS